MPSRIIFCIYLLFVIGVPNKVNASESLLYNILEAADQRDGSATVFDRALAGNKLQEQREALLALGRIGGNTGTLKIAPFLYSPQPDIRAMAAFALGITNDPQAHKLLLSRLKIEQHPVVISRLLIAVGNIANPEAAIANILPFLNHSNSEVVAAACDGLTLAWSFHRDTVSVPNSTQVNRLLELVQKNETLATHCFYTLSRLRRETALFDPEQLLKAAQTLTSTTAKVLAIRTMGALKNELFHDYFSRSIVSDNSVSVRAEAAAAIAVLDYQPSLLPIIKAIAKDSSSHVKVNLIDNLTLSESSEMLSDEVKKLLNDQSLWVKHRTILALFSIKADTMEPTLLKLLKATDFQSQQLLLEILRKYQLPKQQDYLKILAQSKHKGIKSIASRLLKDEDPDAEELNQPNKSIDSENAIALAGKQLNINTTRGSITIQLMTATPFTSANFYQLAKSGFYNGLTFHRVIANFVAQGGDPENTGQGGPGYTIREELYPVEHLRGTVGMATSGKDTGGSQFFFNTADNLHLNNHYTVFARVIKGLALIDKLEAGDQIISISESL